MAGSLLALGLAKLYFRGGVCRVNKDLTGKVAVITGGNEGIGKATVEELLKRNCTVIFGARDEAKSQKFIKSIEGKHKEAKVFFYRLDLADNQSIRRFSEKVSNQVEKIDYLINNAGVMAIPTRQVTRSGFEMQMGINHLGHFYLTFLLWDKLRRAEEPRIINVSALAHRGFSYPKTNIKIDFDDFHYQNGYNPAEAYSRSKVANILFSK